MLKISQKLHTLVTYNYCMWMVLKIELKFAWAFIFYMCGKCSRLCMHMSTYYVPITLVVLSWIWSPLNIRAIPKSEIFGFISSSKRTLLVLRSLWIILNLDSWWRYKIPRAIPIMISKRFPQGRSQKFLFGRADLCC